MTGDRLVTAAGSDGQHTAECMTAANMEGLAAEERCTCATGSDGQRDGDELVAELSEYVCASYPWTWESAHGGRDETSRSVAHVVSELTDRRRIDKIAEELGEVVDAYGGYVGENPRKGVHDTREHVMEELLDVALCALGAWEHMSGHADNAFSALRDHAESRHARAGLR